MLKLILWNADYPIVRRIVIPATYFTPSQLAQLPRLRVAKSDGFLKCSMMECVLFGDRDELMGFWNNALVKASSIYTGMKDVLAIF